MKYIEEIIVSIEEIYLSIEDSYCFLSINLDVLYFGALATRKYCS